MLARWFFLHTFREGNGNQFQYSCLENSLDRGAWWATVHGGCRVGQDLVTIIHSVHHHLGLLAFQTSLYSLPQQLNSFLSLSAHHAMGSKNLDSVTVVFFAKQKKSKEDSCF